MSFFPQKHLNNLGVRDLLWKQWGQIIESIESAFIDPTAAMVPKIYLDCKRGDFRAMPAALKCYASLKWIGVFPDNYQIPTATTQGTLVLSDRETGMTLMTMDCSTLTALRTAATSALVAKYCAPNNIKEIAFIGCGKQAFYHYHAYSHVFKNIETVHLYDKKFTANDYYDFSELCMTSTSPQDSHSEKYSFHDNAKEAVENADIITTLTPSELPYLDIFDVKSDCHINAIGADAIGKRELHDNVISGASDVICDDPEQAFHSGELQYSDWPHLDVISISDLIKNHKTMQLNKGVSVFDSTGVALEDIALAILVYEMQKNLNE